mgnify:FL=1
MDNLQHIDDLLRQASQAPANALVNASDWAVVDKRLKRRKDRIYAIWLFLALVSVSSVVVFFHLNSNEISNTPFLAKTKESTLTEDSHKTTRQFQTTDNINLTRAQQGMSESITTSSTQLYNDTSLRTILTASEDIGLNKQITTRVISSETRVPLIAAQPAPYISDESIMLQPVRNVELHNRDPYLNTLQLITPVRIAHVTNRNTNASESTLPKPERHWEVGVSFTPGLSNKITSQNSTLNGLINRSYNEKIANSETAAFSNTFGFNIQNHMKNWFISSGLFITQRREQLDYNFTITESPLYDATTIYSYVPLDPIAYESIVYSGSNSYRFLEIPVNVGYKTTISRNFELRTQLGASYMALQNREGKKGNYTTLELDDLRNLQFTQHNIAANIKIGLYLDKSRFVLGVEPTFGINLNSIRPVETSAIKTKPYGYGLNITSAIKLFKL